MADMPTTYETKTTTATTSGTTIGLHPEYLRTIPGILKIVEIVLDFIVFICAVIPNWSAYGGGWVTFVSITAFLTTLIFFIFYLTGIYGRLPGPWTLIVLSMITFISGYMGISGFKGGSLVLTASINGFLLTLILFVLHLFHVRCFLLLGQRHIGILSIITFICACVGIWGSGQGWTQFVAMSAFLSTLFNVILHLLNLISRIPGPWLLIEFIYYCVFTLFFLIAAIVCAARAGPIAAIGAAAFFAFAATAVYAVDTFFQFRAWRMGQTETVQTTTTTTTSSTIEQGPTAY